MLELTPSTSVGVIGLGYVGLPLLLGCRELYPTRGFDHSKSRIDALRRGEDHTGASDPSELLDPRNLVLTSDLEQLRGCDIYVVTVPTPIDSANNPDLSLLVLASEYVGRVLSRNSVVIFESTVFPGATEEICNPILERESRLTLNEDYWLGYSPERINPGDSTHRLSDVVKITSGSSEEAADFVDRFYASLVKAGTHRAPSIRVAEAAKVIENIQRDINIALMNEFSQLFHLLRIDTREVLSAASTKWNFLPFKPGLVGGHCIGVDPYYLTYKAREVGFNPQMTLAGRNINNAMPEYVAERVADLILQSGRTLNESKVLVFGITYKQNCPDTRNSRSIDLVKELRNRDLLVEVYDPLAQRSGSELPMDIELNIHLESQSYDAVILSVAHDEFVHPRPEILLSCCKKDGVIYDIQHVLPDDLVTERL